MRLAYVAAGMLLAMFVAGPSLETRAQTAKGRTVVVLADVHMGIGRDAAGTWHPYEDFRGGEEFAAFLEALADQGPGATDLILNGDTFELWQSAEADCSHDDPDLGCTEPEALARLSRVLDAHAAEIRSLGEFASTGDNRVVFVPGDHDAALLFPAVARRLQDTLNAPAGRVTVASEGYWVSNDGQVYVEHGHQIGFSSDKYEGWPRPFVRRSGREHLFRPWGERLIQTRFNRMETRYPIVDNLADESAGVKYGLEAEGTADAGDAAPDLLRYFLLRTPWQGFRWDLDAAGEPKAVKWDLEKVRAQGPAFLLASLPSDDPFHPLASNALADGRLADALASYTDDELTAICDYRAAVRRSRRRNEGGLSQFVDRFGPAGTECPRMPETRGTAFKYFWESRDAVFRRHTAEIRKRLKDGGESLALLVHAHLHLPDRQASELHKTRLGFLPDSAAAKPVVVMAGPWQRTITPARLDQMKVARGVSRKELLSSLQPEDLPACHHFVQSTLENGAPVAALRAWRRGESNDWQIAGGCGGQ